MTRRSRKKRLRAEAAKRDRKRRSNESPALMAKAIAQRKTLPVIVNPERVKFLEERLVPHSEIPALKVAEAITTAKGYQRGVMRNQVNMLMVVIEKGGMLPDPVVLSQRDGKLWIVEGYQRVEASYCMNVGVLARIFQCQSIEDERTLFLAFDAKQRVSADIITAGHPGFVSRLLVEENEREGSLIRHQIDFGRHGGRRFGATPLARALARVAVGRNSFGAAIKWLDRVEAEVATNAAAQMRARRFLDLVMAVWGIGSTRYRVRTLWIEALAMVAHKRWRSGTPMPTQRVINSLRRLDWMTISPANQSRFLPLVVAEIEMKWKVTSDEERRVARR